jgi:lysophospholipase L1-like esterase
MIDLGEDIKVAAEAAEFDPGAEAEKFRVVALGDSITACGSMVRGERWSGILERLLGPDARVINSGLGGTSSSLGLFRWRRDVPPMDPHCVVICFLLNDSHIRHYECSTSYLVQCTPHRMESNMRTMFDLVRLSGADPVVWTPPPVPTWGSEDARMKIQLGLLEQYVAVLERVTTREGVPLVNFWRTFPSLVEGFPGKYFASPDGYHSTVHAQPLLAEKIAEAVGAVKGAWEGSGRD